MGEYPGINVFTWGKGGTASNQNRNHGGGAGVLEEVMINQAVEDNP